jgi:hypothetical protein
MIEIIIKNILAKISNILFITLPHGFNQILFISTIGNLSKNDVSVLLFEISKTLAIYL